MFLENANYSKAVLLDKVVLVTGGGGGIGYEACRAFAYMGAKVVIAEINAVKGKIAQKLINDEFGNNADFYQIDIADEKQIDGLYDYINSKYKHLDALINNAAVVPMGAIDVVSISEWDLSYAVNLRAPVLLTQKFYPVMKNTGGVIVFVPSARTAPFMAAYEIFKLAQVEFCNALFDEIPDNIITYSISPGFVKTDTAIKAVEIVATSMGIETDDFFKSHDEYIFDVELAGVGYAVSVANAEKYNGQFTSSQQVLLDAGLITQDNQNNQEMKIDYTQLSPLYTRIANIFREQYQSWQTKKLFQKQFILSDFKKFMGLPAERFKEQVDALQGDVQNQKWEQFLNSRDLFKKWQGFYEHQKELLKKHERNPILLANDTKLLDSWIAILQSIIDAI